MTELFPEPENTTPTAEPTPWCELCGKDFVPRTGSGGKRQRFCSPECRIGFHRVDRLNQKEEAQRPQRKEPHVGEDDPPGNNAAAEKTRTNDDAKPKTVIDYGDFDWLNNDHIILHEQRGTALYWNPNGDLVIRQRADWNEENDPFLVISRNNAQDFIDKLCDIAGIFGAGKRS